MLLRKSKWVLCDSLVRNSQCQAWEIDWLICTRKRSFDWFTEESCGFFTTRKKKKTQKKTNTKQKKQISRGRTVKVIALFAAENVHVNENWIALVLMCISLISIYLLAKLKRKKNIRQYYCFSLYLRMKTHTLKKHQLVTAWEGVCIYIYAHQKRLSTSLLNSQSYFMCSAFRTGFVLMAVSGSRSLAWCSDPSKGLILDVQEIGFPSMTFHGSSSAQLLTNRRDA